MDALIFSSGNDRSSFPDRAHRGTTPARWRKIQYSIATTAFLSFFSAQYCNAEPIPRTQIKSFDAPDASQTMPKDINNSLTIVGTAYHPDNTDTSFVYRNGIRETTSPTRIYYAINDQGQIFGAEYQQTTNGNLATTCLVKTGNDIVYSNPPCITPTTTNDNGVTIGESEEHVFIAKGDDVWLFLEDWEDIDPEDEGGVHGTSAVNINNSDVVVGNFIVNGGGVGGYIYDHRNGSLTTVHHPSGEDTELNRINDWGLIVGNHYPGDETSQGFAYFDGKFIPVEVGKLSTTVTGVNEWGFITGSYRDSWQEKEHAYVAHILPFIFWDQIN